MGSGQWTSTAWTSYVQKNPKHLHVLILAQTTHFQPIPFTWFFGPEHFVYLTCILSQSCFIFVYHISPLSLLPYLQQKKNPPLLPFYPDSLDFTSISPSNTFKIYEADLSYWAEMGHMLALVPALWLGHFPSHLSAYKSESLPGEHRWLDNNDYPFWLNKQYQTPPESWVATATVCFASPNMTHRVSVYSPQSCITSQSSTQDSVDLFTNNRQSTQTSFKSNQ